MRNQFSTSPANQNVAYNVNVQSKIATNPFHVSYNAVSLLHVGQRSRLHTQQLDASELCLAKRTCNSCARLSRAITGHGNDGVAVVKVMVIVKG